MMIKSINRIVVLLLCLSAALAAQPPAQSHDVRLQWFREAKFGLFVHWGLYALPAGVWKGIPFGNDVTGEWIMFHERIPVAEYEALAARFNPVKFNAEEWVRMVQNSGMKYIVITAKHHEGFAMYHSLVSKYNIYDATPFHRDPLQELAAACARHGIKLGFYYSQTVDWHEPNGMGNSWDFAPDKAKDFEQYLRTKSEPQMRELLTNYGPVCLIWFDMGGLNAEQSQRFIDMVHELQPQCLINGRLGSAGDYRSMGDNEIPGVVLDGDWDVPATLNETWGYKKFDTNWKPPQDVIFKLVDVASKGGNYLLNVGPTAEGDFPEEAQRHLRVVGDWLKVNGEAIYGAGATPFGPELGAYDPVKTDGQGKPLFLPKTAWRCTTRPGKLYLHLFDWPAGSFALDKMRGTVKKAYFLADAEHRPLKFQQQGEHLTIKLPAKAPFEMAPVVVLETR